MSGDVAIIGGGLAGLAAGCALAESGYRVSLFERRPYLGGRASSYQHPGTGEVVDNCQHVLLGCCTNLLDFYRRIGVQDKIRWYDRLTFIEPGGRRAEISPSWMPAPLHSLPSFVKAGVLSLGDKMAIGRAMLALARRLPEDAGQPFLHWLRAHGQTERAMERFWKVVLVSALNEDLERCSARYAALVFRESFLKSAAGGRMGVPAVPLSELYGAAGEYIRARGGEVTLRAAVESFRPEREGVRLCVGGREVRARFAVSAVPFDVLGRMLPEGDAADELRRRLDCLESSPITGIHLWFDREFTDLHHAVLLERTIQWMFQKSKILRLWEGQAYSAAEGISWEGQGASRAESVPQDEGALAPEGKPASYLELVVSSSKGLVQRSRPEIIELALRELREFFPAAQNAKLLKATVIKEISATYSPRPGADAYRPSPQTAWKNVFLAGDWIMTGWPATMEGAVRSGYLAAEAIAGKRFVVPDLPAEGMAPFVGDL